MIFLYVCTYICTHTYVKSTNKMSLSIHERCRNVLKHTPRVNARALIKSSHPYLPIDETKEYLEEGRDL